MELHDDVSRTGLAPAPGHRMAAAMGEAACVLGTLRMPVAQTPVVEPAVDAELEEVRQLLHEYAQLLDVDLCFQDFEAELAALPGEYAAPRGALLVARVNGVLAGCCGLRALDTADHPNACELKRLFVRPAFRAQGLGRKLVEAILAEAVQADYDCVLLDTLDTMEAARALYEELGFKEVAPYYYNPIAGAHYLKAQLRRR